MSAFDNVEFIKASAGSGKTYKLMNRVAELVINEHVSVTSILATTFTVKAASELKSRIRGKLLDAGRTEEAQQVEDSLIGTVDGVCGRLLSDYAIDAGENPSMMVLPEENAEEFFSRALSETISGHQETIVPLAERLGFDEGAWLTIIRNLVNAARSNHIGEDCLADARNRSIEVAKKVYDGADETLTLDGFNDELRPYLDEIKEVAEAFGKDEVSAKETFGGGLCRFCKAAIEYGGNAWKELLSLSNKKPSARKTSKPELRDALLGLHESVGDRLLHSKALQQDVVAFVSEVFDMAREGLDKFQSYKREFGLVDFVDQEVKLLDLLEADNGEAFRKALKDRIKIVMVDEFQDTSPLQLAIFLKLNEIVGRSVWVCDPKQSIYSFRGADPSFMAEVIKGVEAADKERVDAGKTSLINVLPYSWRSRENLVEFANEVFTRTFPSTPQKEVRLGLKDDEKGKIERQDGCISVWQKKATYQYANEALMADLACRVKRMFDGAHPQLAKYSDLAILLRTNSECFKLAAALRRQGLTVSVGGGQLKDEPIAYLGMCAYRRAFSLKDTVAEEVLKRHLPGVDVDTVEDVEQNLTPLELLERSLIAYGVDDYVRGSGDVEYGLATLEALRDLCREYMSDCALRGVPATQADFIRYFNEAEKEGASAAGADCIQVMTYHKAKGLEWPVVILCSLDDEPVGSPFGVRVVQNGAFDPEAPLANRTIQYLPAPFGANHNNEITPFMNQGIAEFDGQHKAVLAQEMEEARRLMYVGVTRAKDEVVFFAKRQTTGKVPDGVPQIQWLNSMTAPSLFTDNFMNVEANAKWRIGDCQRKFDVDMELLPDRDAVEDMAHVAGWSDAVAADTPCHPPFRVSPSSMEGTEVGAVVGQEVRTGDGMGVATFSRASELGDCVHAYMAVSVPGKDESRQLAERVVGQWKLSAEVDADRLVLAAKGLRAFIDDRWPGAVVHAEVPMSIVLPTGEVSEGFIDMLLETANGYVVIDHKMVRSFDAEKLRTDYGVQLQCYAMAVEKATGKKVLQTFLHLPNQGVCLELKTDWRKDA